MAVNVETLEKLERRIRAYPVLSGSMLLLPILTTKMRRRWILSPGGDCCWASSIARRAMRHQANSRI